MAVHEESVTRLSPLVAIIPLVAFLGLMTYFGFSLSEGGGNFYLYQVGVLIGLIVYVLTFVNVILGIAVLIACIGLSPEISLVGIRNLRLEDFIVPALAAAWLTRAIKSRESAAHSRIRGPMLLYLAAMAASSILGIAGGSVKPQTAVLYFGKFLEYFLIFLIVVHNVKTEREFKALVLFSLLIGMAGGILGAFRMRGVDGRSTINLQGPLGETATIFGGYLFLNLSVAVGLYLNARTPGNRLAAASSASLLFVATSYTFSRTTYAAITGGLVVFAGLKNRRMLVIILLLAVAFPLLAPESIWQRAATIGTIFTEAETPSWVARIAAWKTALGKVLASAPLLGFGLGSVHLGDVDNDYVRVIHDLGFVGLAIFLWWLFRLFRVANGTYEALPPGTFHKGFAAGYLMAFFGLAVHAIGATSFTSIRVMEQFMLLSGLMVCLANNREAWEAEAIPLGASWEAEVPLPRPG